MTVVTNTLQTLKRIIKEACIPQNTIDVKNNFKVTISDLEGKLTQPSYFSLQLTGILSEKVHSLLNTYHKLGPTAQS